MTMTGNNRPATAIRSATQVACLLLIGALAATATRAWGEPVRIMSVGDSITVGATSLDGPPYNQPHVPFEYGYRSGLYTRLIDANYPSFQFVGSSPQGLTIDPVETSCVDLAALNQQYHNGYGGVGVSYIASNIAGWMRADNPDVVLLMIGINDIGQGSVGEPTALENRLNSLVRTVVTLKPSAHLIVAQTIPYATGYTDSLVRYNNYIKNTLVPSYSSQGKLVTTVDQYSPLLTNGVIDPSLYSNAINHPSAVGYDRMAQNWFDGIESLGPVTHTPLPPNSIAIHSVTDSNLLSNKPVVASSLYGSTFDPAYATDGTTAQQVFKSTWDAGTDSDMRLVIHGINSGFNLLRIWQDLDDFNRIPAQLTVKSSLLDTTSLEASNFETALASLSALTFNAEGYVDIAVSAPSGTQSLFLDFGSVDSLGQPYGVRVMEVQAFLVPEPSMGVLLLCGMAALAVWTTGTAGGRSAVRRLKNRGLSPPARGHLIYVRVSANEDKMEETNRQAGGKEIWTFSKRVHVE
jgi:hypothetical protein